MNIGKYEILFGSHPDKEELVAEVSRDNLEMASVHIENGIPTIEIGPNRREEHGVWTLDYHTFKQIVAALDDFLVSIGYPPDEPIEDEA